MIPGEQQPTGTARDSAQLVLVLAAATFVIFFQAFMVAPILPHLASVLETRAEHVGWMVPAYLLPYGVATLLWGPLADRVGRGRLMLGSLGCFVALTAISATSRSADELIAWRALTGLGASAVVPLGLALIGTLYPYERRGRPLGWVFGAMAGGMAVGSTVGAVAVPVIGWRGLFAGVALLGIGLFALLWPRRGLLGRASDGPPPRIASVLGGYAALLRTARGSRTYLFVFLNAAFHAGVFTWLGVYFSERFGLGEVGIGLALLGYGIPGFVLGPAIGKAADTVGRRRLIPLGLFVAAVAALALAAPVGLLAAALFVTAVSLGYDLTQPLLAGIVTTLDPKRPGQAMGLNVFALFSGFAVGSAVFAAALRGGVTWALVSFGAAQTLLALLAIPLFAGERRRETVAGATS